jgi:hypothetical protein
LQAREVVSFGRARERGPGGESLRDGRRRELRSRGRHPIRHKRSDVGQVALRRRWLHPVLEPGRPAGNVRGEIHVGAAGPQPVEVIGSLGIVEGAERERPLRHAIEQVPGSRALRAEGMEHPFDGPRRCSIGAPGAALNTAGPRWHRDVVFGFPSSALG